jgi:hypothetical protein
MRGKATLPRKRRYTETAEFAGAAARMVKRLGIRLSMEDPDYLVFLVALDEKLEEAWRVAIAGQRGAKFTDREIGAQLGITRQAVEQRWPRSDG